MMNLHFRRTRQRSSKGDVPGMKVDQEEISDDDAQWYKQEVGVEPDPGKASVCDNLHKLSPSVCVCVCLSRFALRFETATS